MASDASGTDDAADGSGADDAAAGPAGGGQADGPDSGAPVDRPDMDDVLEDLEDLETLVDSDEERERVREAMRTARKADRSRVVGRIRDSFDSRDVGEAVVGSFIFGIPMIVEGGTLEIGEAIAGSPVALALTALFGLVLAVGVLHAARFEEVEEDMLLGFVPVRLVSILVIAGALATGLMTLWARVDWSEPSVAFAQTLVTAVVMVVGASLGDVLPE